MNSQRTVHDLVPDLLEVADEFARAKDRATITFGALDDQAINHRPSENKWSVAECLDHLCVSGYLYLTEIDTALAAAETANIRKDPPYRYSLLAAWFERKLGQVPPNSRMRSPRSFLPRSNHSAADILERFRQLQDDLLTRVKRSNGIDLGKTRLSSPAMRLVKIPLGQAFRILAAHQRRHLWQADEAMRFLNAHA